MPVMIQQWIVNHDHVPAERDAFTERRTLLIHGSTENYKILIRKTEFLRIYSFTDF